MRDTADKLSRRLCTNVFIIIVYYYDDDDDDDDDYYYYYFMFLFRSLLQVEPHQINRLSLVMNYHVKFGKHFTSRFHSSHVWCYIHVRYKKAAFKVKLYLYLSLRMFRHFVFQHTVEQSLLETYNRCKARECAP